MRHTMVAYTVKTGREEENAALVRDVFEELAQTRPAGLRYAVFYLPRVSQFIGRRPPMPAGLALFPWVWGCGLDLGEIAWR